MKTPLLATALIVLGGVTTGFSMQDRPDALSGTITRTFSIVANTVVTGDVTCAVPDGTPCLSFAVPGVELRLNGYTLTGKGDPITGCGGAATPGEVGITTNGQRAVVVRGPGLIRQFRNHGVLVAGSNGARIEGITVSTNCGSGIFVPGSSFETLIQENTAVRNGASAPGLSCGGI